MIYDGSDSDEQNLIERVLMEPDREIGRWYVTRKLSPTAYHMQSINSQEMKLHKLRPQITKGILYWARIEDDLFQSSRP